MIVRRRAAPAATEALRALLTIPVDDSTARMEERMLENASTPRRRTERAMTLSSGKPLAQASPARKCAYPACQTRLSRYNPDACCSAHGGWVDAEGAARARRGE